MLNELHSKLSERVISFIEKSVNIFSHSVKLVVLGGVSYPALPHEDLQEK